MRLENSTSFPSDAETVAVETVGPSWLPIDDARTAVEVALRAVLEGICAESGGPTALALRVTVGVGKSAGLRKVLAETAPWILAKGHILVHVPTHALAEEAHAAFCALGTGISSMVLRGRDTKDHRGDPLDGPSWP